MISTLDGVGVGRGRVLAGVVAVVVALVLAGCTASGDAEPGDEPGDGATGQAVQDPSDIQGGDGACTDALRSGPLIDPSDQALGAPQPGEEPLPIVNLPRLDTCELGSTADWLGGPLVINFWASWCGPCRAEMPDLDEWARSRTGEVDLVGVNIDFRQVDAEEFLEQVPVDFPSWFDPDAQVLGDRVSIRSMPTTLFVDADGLIVHRHLGPISRDQLDDAASEHLGV